MMSHWPESLWVNLIILRVNLTRLYVYDYYSLWSHLTYLCVKSILLYVFVMYNSSRMTFHISVWFVMHNSVWMNIHIIQGFGLAHICMNEYFIPIFFPTRFFKMGIFSCFLSSFARINIWGRESCCLSYQWWILRCL